MGITLSRLEQVKRVIIRELDTNDRDLAPGAPLKTITLIVSFNEETGAPYKVIFRKETQSSYKPVSL